MENIKIVLQPPSGLGLSGNMVKNIYGQYQDLIHSAGRHFFLGFLWTVLEAARSPVRCRECVAYFTSKKLNFSWLVGISWFWSFNCTVNTIHNKCSPHNHMHRRSHSCLVPEKQNLAHAACPTNVIAGACTFNLPGQTQVQMWSPGRQCDGRGVNGIASASGRLDCTWSLG